MDSETLRNLVDILKRVDKVLIHNRSYYSQLYEDFSTIIKFLEEEEKKETELEWREQQQVSKETGEWFYVFKVWSLQWTIRRLWKNKVWWWRSPECMWILHWWVAGFIKRMIFMTIEEFKRALKDGDFAIGDSFWLNNIEFEVVKKRW